MVSDIKLSVAEVHGSTWPTTFLHSITQPWIFYEINSNGYFQDHTLLLFYSEHYASKM